MHDREKILEQSKNQGEKMNRIFLDLKQQKEKKVGEKEFHAELNFLKEFQEKIVEPNYEGNFFNALKDLMKKALEEEKTN